MKGGRIENGREGECEEEQDEREGRVKGKEEMNERVVEEG